MTVLAVAPLTVESHHRAGRRVRGGARRAGRGGGRARRSTSGLWLVTAATVLLDAWLLAEAQTLAGSMLVLTAFSYPVLYAAYAFEGRLLHAMLVLTTVASAVGLARSDAGLRWVAWAAAVGGVVLAAVALGRVMALLRWYATVDTLTGVADALGVRGRGDLRPGRQPSAGRAGGPGAPRPGRLQGRQRHARARRR